MKWLCAYQFLRTKLSFRTIHRHWRSFHVSIVISISLSLSLSFFHPFSITLSLSLSLSLFLTIVKRAVERNDSSTEMFSVSRFYRRKLARKRGVTYSRKVSDVYPRSPSKEYDRRMPIDTSSIWKYANLRIKRAGGLRWNTSRASECFFSRTSLRSVVARARVNILSMRSLLASVRSYQIASTREERSSKVFAVLFDDLYL